MSQFTGIVIVGRTFFSYLMVCGCLMVPGSLFGQISEVEQSVLQIRKSLASGKVVVESLGFDPDNFEHATSSTRYTILFSDRNNSTMHETSSIDQSGGKHMFSKLHAILSGDSIWRRDFLPEQPDTLIASHTTVAVDTGNWQSALGNIFDPRLIGLMPTHFDVLHSCTLEEFVANPNRSSTGVTTDSVDGNEYTLVTFQSEDVTNKIWIDPDRDFGVVRAEMSAGKERLILENELAQFPNDDGNVWFPKQVTYTTLLDGKMTSKNVARIVEAVFNQPIEPGKFAFESLDLPAGNLVVDSRNIAKPKMWDGKKLVSIGRPSTPDPAKRSFPWWALGILAFGLAAFTYWHFKNRKK